MEPDDISLWLKQPVLFSLGTEKTGSVELFPAVWYAAEGLVSSNVEIRRKSASYLAGSGAARFSPLVAYIIASRLGEPDDETRACLIETLAGVLTPDKDGNTASEEVRQTLVSYLTEMRTRQIYSLLLAIQNRPVLIEMVARLFHAAPFGGLHLAEIASSRKFPIEIRRIALKLVDSVGYLDALPTLERMLQRLEARVAGQQTLPFAPPGSSDDMAVLPELRVIINSLKQR